MPRLLPVMSTVPCHTLPVWLTIERPAASYPYAMTGHGTRFTAAIVRPPAASYAAGLTTATLGTPDLSLALAQHAAYCAALEQLGVRVTALPPDEAFPDSTFVADTAVVTAHGAIVARPGAPSRAGEVATIRQALEARLGTVAAIAAPGTVDGDICQADRSFFIGVSHRTNEEGARQLADWLARAGTRPASSISGGTTRCRTSRVGSRGSAAGTWWLPTPWPTIRPWRAIAGWSRPPMRRTRPIASVSMTPSSSPRASRWSQRTSLAWAIAW